MDVMNNLPKGKQGKTTIADNLVKQRVYIDKDGNEVEGPKNGRYSNEIVRKADEEVPAGSQEVPQTQESTNPLAEVIKKQVQEAVRDSIKDININQMVQQAIKDAFK